MSKLEIEGEIAAMDWGGDGCVSFEDFHAWWVRHDRQTFSTADTQALPSVAESIGRQAVGGGGEDLGADDAAGGRSAREAVTTAVAAAAAAEKHGHELRAQGERLEKLEVQVERIGSDVAQILALLQQRD